MRACRLLLVAAIAAASFLTNRGCEAHADLHFPIVAKSPDDAKVIYKGRDFGYSGYASVPVEGSATKINHIFWWYQPPLEVDTASKDFPLLIWLQGGPGGPGTFGSMCEIGNWFVNSSAELEERCFSWCRTNGCLFVDQPVQTGFSYQTDGGIFKNDTITFTNTSRSAMAQVTKVVDETFFHLFPELRSHPLYITGESYGGLYIPNLAIQMVRAGKSESTPAHHDRAPLKTLNSSSYVPAGVFNLQGIAVGDPAIDWYTQMPAYPIALKGLGMIMDDEKRELEQTFSASVAAMRQGECRRGFELWNTVWDDDGGFSPSHGRCELRC